MPLSNRVLRFGDRELTVRFTNFAKYRLEQLSCEPIGALLEKIQTTGNVSVSDFTNMLVAGLDGHRVWSRDRRGEWTVEEVSELVDLAGGWVPLAQPLIEGFLTSFPTAAAAVAGQEAPREGKE